MIPCPLMMQLVFLLLISNLTPCHAQINESLDPEKVIHEAENEETAGRYIDQNIENTLKDHIQNPLNLNQASFDEIIQFPLWDFQLSSKIFKYIQDHKPLLSVYELQSIAGIPLDILRNSLPYITIGIESKKIPLLKLIRSKGNHSLFIRWGRIFNKDSLYNQVDSSNNTYIGSPDKIYFRYKSAVPGRYSIGISLEKDAGETWFNARYIKTIDFISASLVLENLTQRLKSIAIGDYTLRLGQGLLIDNAFSIGKSYQFGSIAKTPSVVKPYQSVRESDMLRGVATKISLQKKIDMILFYSAVNKDANQIEKYNQATGTHELIVSTIQSSGLHRSKSELADQNTFRIKQGGLSIHYNSPNLNFGINGIFNLFNTSLNNAHRIDKIYYSQRKEAYAVSFHHQWIYKNYCINGELAIANSGHYASIENLLIGLGKQAEAICSYRNFSPGFYQLLSNTISTNALSTNEKAIYFAINLYPTNRIFIHGNIEFIAYPWLRYQHDFLTTSHLFTFKIQYTERKKWLSYLQIRHKINQESNLEQIFLKEKFPIEYFNSQLRIHLESRLKMELIWRSRIEFHWVNKNNSVAQGFAISQDLLYKSIESKFSGNLRLALFDISNYDSRIYEFENDVLSQYQLSAYNGRGIRAYVNIRCRPLKACTFEMKLATSYFFQFDEHQNFEIADQTAYESELKFQFRYQF
ncbi:MAG: hypothetical protein WAS55_03170 [Saprospiraceae bacterium]|nr:hypothetical protein [Saprospiraceae bacterium]